MLSVVICSTPEDPFIWNRYDDFSDALAIFKS